MRLARRETFLRAHIPLASLLVNKSSSVMSETRSTRVLQFDNILLYTRVSVRSNRVDRMT